MARDNSIEEISYQKHPDLDAEQVESLIGSVERRMKACCGWLLKRSESALARGVLFAALGDVEKAEEIYREVIRNRSTAWYARFYLARIHYEKNRLDDAVKELENLTAQGCTWMRVHLLLGRCYAGLGNNDLTLESLRTACALSKTPYDFRIAFWEFLVALFRLKRFEDIEKELSDKSSRIQDDTSFLVNIACLHATFGKLDAAVSMLKEIISKHPRCVPALKNLGTICHHVGQHGEALELLKKALCLEPGNPDIHRKLASVYKAVGDLETAVQHERFAGDTVSHGFC